MPPLGRHLSSEWTCAGGESVCAGPASVCSAAVVDFLHVANTFPLRAHTHLHTRSYAHFRVYPRVSLRVCLNVQCDRLSRTGAMLPPPRSEATGPP